MRLRLLFVALFGAGLLGSLGPVESPWSGVVAGAACVGLARSLRRLSFTKRILWSLAASLSAGLFAFQWVLPALTNIAHIPVVAAVPAFVLQAALFNLKIPFLFLLFLWISPRTRVSRVWVFAALAASGDLLMYQLFPWYWGNMIAGSDLLRQTARLWGVAGLSFVAFAASVTAHDVLHLWVRARKIADARLGARALWSVLGRRKLGRNSLAWPLLFLTLSFTYGTWRLLDAEPSPRTLNVAWVQPGTPPALQKYKNDDQFAAHALNAVFNVSAEAIFRSGGSIDLLLIPESSVPFLGTLESHENQNHGLYSTTYLAVIAYLARLGETDVLYNEISFEDGRLQNLATAFTRYGKRSLSYQKRHLVPFGEYLPGERWAPVLRRLFPEASAYEPGSTPRLLETSWIPGRTEKRLPVLRQSDLNVLSDARRVLSEWPASVRPTETVRIAPLICYEGLFPGLVRDSFGAAETSPDLIVNLVNDSWFGDYLENYQHALASRMRAVESGRTLVRSALSGVSGVWDPWGQRLGPELEVGAQGYAAASVPLYGGGPTPYMRWGDMPLFFVLSVITLAALLLRRRRGPPRLQ